MKASPDRLRPLGSGGRWARAIRDARAGDGGLVLVEGPKGIADLLREGRRPSVLVFREGEDGLERRIGPPADCPVFEARERLFDRLAATRTPQGVLGLFARPESSPADLRDAGLVLVLDQLQDPGNVGALIRTAVGLGADAVVVGRGSARPFGPRAVRASAGAAFALPVVEADDPAALVSAEGLRVAVAAASGGEHPDGLDWSGRWAVVLGNEGHGSEIKGDRRVTVPMAGGRESLGVAAAGAVLLTLLVRLRGAAGPC